MATQKPSVVRSSLTAQVYRTLRDRLMSGRFQPGERLKIGELAADLDVSETPVREAILLLTNDGAIEMKAGYYFLTRRLSLAEYMEIRRLRLLLEPLAAVEALPHVDADFIAELERIHATLIRAEKERDYPQAVKSNFDFHFTLYRRSGMSQLTDILERLWIQAGPLLNYLYPHGHPTYRGDHQHKRIIAALKAGDARALSSAVEQDLIEGGEQFVAYLETIDGQEAEPVKKSSSKSVRRAPRA
ncbi:GntR family transcriptional regulator [Bordetella hinzii]|uniref:GntR family transcriptional regulator n=1 Tax=Bordetella hinzii TaxID=103855 RepID=UPI0004232A29|nr:GntR family transcriptional regulator [Bordetella hinzii]AKQ55848.1 HTH-type transcriptional regulator McbR [Bordetella hinzii]KCB25175.1 HTH-type transcriptional regulator McbR family protein [Bordetella hinzii L60]KCB46022.1 HTH-type transcriptional regulator McbR family protein [Bordetella hinzii 4161]KCB52444.1 HTH-type transcriptional regulator McbR family protein [Bordetella hinzii 1277]KXA71492.1 AsnC family transcriptional regulator [Bordetella hinzii LMG 13501]